MPEVTVVEIENNSDVRVSRSLSGERHRKLFAANTALRHLLESGPIRNTYWNCWGTKKEGTKIYTHVSSREMRR